MSEIYSDLTEEVFNEMMEYYNNKLPDPEQYPKCFAHAVKTFLYCYKKDAEDAGV